MAVVEELIKEGENKSTPPKVSKKLNTPMAVLAQVQATQKPELKAAFDNLANNKPSTSKPTAPPKPETQKVIKPNTRGRKSVIISSKNRQDSAEKPPLKIDEDADSVEKLRELVGEQVGPEHDISFEGHDILDSSVEQVST